MFMFYVCFIEEASDTELRYFFRHLICTPVAILCLIFLLFTTLKKTQKNGGTTSTLVVLKFLLCQ